MNAGLALLPTTVGSLILLAGAVDDLKTQKVHNWLFLACAAIGLISSIVALGSEGLISGLLGFLAGIVVLLPLVLGKMIGAGDMKILAAFGCAVDWNAVVTVAVFSLIWGTIFGVIRIIVKGQGMTFLMNLFAIITRDKKANLQLHKMPFTIALLLGWLSYLSYGALI